MTFTLLAAAALAQPASPLSPADLPPPPRPAGATPTPLPAAAPARQVGLAGAVYTSLNIWQATGSPAEVRRKVLAVLAGYPGVRFAAVGPTGAVEGYTADVRVVAFAFPVGPKSQVYVAAAAARDEPAARITKAVQDGVEARAAADGPERVGRPDAGFEKALPVLDWHAEVRPVPRLTRHVKPVTMFLIEKAGLVPDGGLDASSFGVVGVPFEAPDQTTSGWQFISPGVPTLDVQFVTVTAVSPGAAPRPARPLGEALTRLLYD